MEKTKSTHFSTYKAIKKTMIKWIFPQKCGKLFYSQFTGGKSFPQLSVKIWEIFKNKEKNVEKTVEKSKIRKK